MSVVEVHLPDDLAGYVAEQVAAGGHADAGAFIVNALRERQRAEDWMAAERKAIDAAESLSRGEGRPVTPAEFLALRERMRQATPE